MSVVTDADFRPPLNQSRSEVSSSASPVSSSEPSDPHSSPRSSNPNALSNVGPPAVFGLSSGLSTGISMSSGSAAFAWAFFFASLASLAAAFCSSVIFGLPLFLGAVLAFTFSFFFVVICISSLSQFVHNWSNGLSDSRYTAYR